VLIKEGFVLIKVNVSSKPGWNLVFFNTSLRGLFFGNSKLAVAGRKTFPA
jgi:hypothetical protein